MEETYKKHTPVLLDEMLDLFKDVHLHTYVDATLGAAGHAKAILQAHPEIKHFIGIDKDPEAINIASEVLTPWKEKTHFFHGNFLDMDQILLSLGIREVDGFFLI